MKKQTKNQKGFSPIPTVIIIGVVVVVIALFLSTQKGGLPAPKSSGIKQTTQNALPIQNASGLNTTASELDNTDLSAVDRELNQLDEDTSSF